MRNTTAIKKIGSHKVESDLAIVLLSASPHKQTGIYRPTLEFSDGNNLLYKQLSTIDKAFPNADLLVVLGYEPDNIYKNPSFQHLRFIENQNFLTTNTIKSAALAMRASNAKSYIFIHGDMYFNEAAISIAGSESALVVGNGDTYNDRIGLIPQDNNIVNIGYGLQKPWGQIVYLTGLELEIFQNFCYNKAKSKCLLFEGIANILENGGQFKQHSNSSIKLLEISSKKDIEGIKC
jgi:choline kinase